MKPSLTPTNSSDADVLVSIRIAAMRDSLERIGRFDPQRARERFLASFDPMLCHFIEIDTVRVGFCVVRPLPDLLHLDHLYLLPEYQAKGIGGAVMTLITVEADAKNLPIQVGALRGSKANSFYQRHGFEQVDEAEWDIYYRRQPRPGTER